MMKGKSHDILVHCHNFFVSAGSLKSKHNEEIRKRMVSEVCAGTEYSEAQVKSEHFSFFFRNIVRKL